MTEKLRPRFWETVPLAKLTPPEWEALCDGCGKCCLNKIEFEDDGEVAFTRVACRLLDGDTCRCKHYETRRQFVRNVSRFRPPACPRSPTGCRAPAPICCGIRASRFTLGTR